MDLFVLFNVTSLALKVPLLFNNSQWLVHGREGGEDMGYCCGKEGGGGVVGHCCNVDCGIAWCQIKIEINGPLPLCYLMRNLPKMAADAMLDLIPLVLLQLAACRNMCSAHSWAIMCRNVPACSPRSRMVLALLHLDKVLGWRREEVEQWWDPQESCTDSSWHSQPPHKSQQLIYIIYIFAQFSKLELVQINCSVKRFNGSAIFSRSK